MAEEYDFSGWATKNDLRCSDGRIIRKGAFSTANGKRVPLVYNHDHDDIKNVLGHADLEERNEGVYAYCKLNDTPEGRHAKEVARHGDIVSLSICANNLQQNGSEVLHGNIREVSMVLTGANPGALIESILSHGIPLDPDDDEAILYTGEGIHLFHADGEVENNEEEGEEIMAKERTVEDVYNEMTDEQKEVVAAIVGAAVEDAQNEEDDDEEEEDDEEMRHGIFDESQATGTYLSHADQANILADAKKTGSFREALLNYLGDDELMHAETDPKYPGMTMATGTQTYGFNDANMLFPDYKTLNTTPEFIQRDMGWVNRVMGSVHRTPFSRIKSVYADITEDDARARGYIKGKQKKEEVFTTLKRTTDPQTVYKKQKLDRDDVVDITDFDVVSWIRGEMRLMLNEEIARAILIGDGRASDSDDKIKEAHIRPVVKDVSLFNITVEVTPGDTNAATAENTIDAALRARKNYKGSGNPIFWTTEDVLTEMLLLKDKIGHRLYKTEAELATALRVSSIVTVEPMEGMKIDNKELIGCIVNLADYNVGADKGGQINNFEDFDIDYNQMKYLIETRISGALIKPFSAITLLKGAATPVTPPSGGDD